MSASSDILLIGGGVIGLSLAWELSQRGHSVRLVEADRLGRGASWAGAGILPPTARQGATDPYELLRGLSHELHPAWAQQLKAATGIDTGFQRCGGIYLARSPAEMATLAANQVWWQEHGIEHQQWSLDELARREPALLAHSQTRFLAAWFLPDECQIRNPRHIKALVAACRQQGVELIESARVERIETDGSQASRVITQQGDFTAAQTCVCSGAWARQLLDQLQIRSGLLPVRGQMLLYNCGQRLLTSVINEGHRYLVPRDDGYLLAGSIEEEVGYVVETTDAGIALIRQWAEQILPALKQLPLEKSWAGLRPGSYDSMPYLGRVPAYDNLFVATGHFRSGLHLSCATAVVMANEMLGLPSPIDLRPFRVGRG